MTVPGTNGSNKEWHPLLVKLIDYAVLSAELARDLVHNHPEVLRLKTPSVGESALHFLAIEDYAEAVQLLIDLGADVNATNNFGDSPLHDAIRAQAGRAVDVLRRAGARDISNPEADG